MANLKKQKRTASGSQLRTVLNEQPVTVRLSNVDEVMVAVPENNLSSTMAGRIMPEQFGPCGGANQGSNSSDLPNTRLSGMESPEELRKIVNQVSWKIFEHFS